MSAIQEPNVDVHFTPVESITEKGVVGGDGEEREVDTIICATGFDVSYRPRFPIIGQNGTDLADKWKVCPEGKSCYTRAGVRCDVIARATGESLIFSSSLSMN